MASAPSSRSRNRRRFGRPVRLSCTASWRMRSSAVFISVTSPSVPTTRTTSPSEPTTGRAFSRVPVVMAVGVFSRKSICTRPRRCSSTASSVARNRSRSKGCITSSQFAAGPSSAPRLQAELRLDLRADIDPVGHDVPVEHRVAGTGERQRLALAVADEALRQRAAREGVLHDREADQHDDEHEPAQQGRRHEVVGELPGYGEGRRDDPGQQQEPGRRHHHRAVIAVRGEIDHQDESDAPQRPRWRCAPRPRRRRDRTPPARSARPGTPATPPSRGCSAHASGSG